MWKEAELKEYLCRHCLGGGDRITAERKVRLLTFHEALTYLCYYSPGVGR